MPVDLLFFLRGILPVSSALRGLSRFLQVFSVLHFCLGKHACPHRPIELRELPEGVAGWQVKNLGFDSSLPGFVIGCILFCCGCEDFAGGDFGKIAGSIGHCYNCRSELRRLCPWTDHLHFGGTEPVFQMDAERIGCLCPTNWMNG